MPHFVLQKLLTGTKTMQTMTPHKIYKVFLVEDDNGTLQRLAEVVRDVPNLDLVGMAMNFADASAWLEQNKLDVLLTDLGLPDGHGRF